MQIAICDDEQLYIDQISSYLLKYENSMEFSTEQFLSGEDLLCSINEGKFYSIIFLDIKMGKLNGIETAKEIRRKDRDAIIIFISSHREFVFEGYGVRAFQYLIKPVLEGDFTRLFLSASEEINCVINKKLIIRKNHELITLNQKDIVFIESFGRKVILHSFDNVYEYYSKISDEEIKLSPGGFIRIHKSILVNMAFIKTFNKMSIELHDGQTVPVSEKRKKAVFDEFTEYLIRS